MVPGAAQHTCPVTLGVFATAFSVLVVGAAVQRTAGFGANLLAAPLLVLLDPALVPGALLVASVGLNVAVAATNRTPKPWWRLRWAVAGQVVGAACGAALLGWLPTDRLAIVFAVVILTGVTLTASGWSPRRDPGTMAAAGGASGFMGTTAGFGGPPIALVHADLDGPDLRAALSRFFMVGIVVAVVALSLAGRFGREELVDGLLLTPGMLVGFAVAGPLVRRVDRRRLRVVVLGVSAVAALTALVRALVGT